MCLVEVENAPKLQIACNTRSPRDGGAHPQRPRQGGAARGARVPARSTIRSTAPSATRPASASSRTTTWTTTASPRASRCARTQQGQGDRHRPRRDARPGTLHPVRALHALLGRGHADQRTRRSSGAATITCIDIFPGQQLDNELRGQHRRHLPGGALTEKDFRFRMRVWYLHRRPRCAADASADVRSISINITAVSTASSRATTRGQRLLDVR